MLPTEQAGAVKKAIDALPQKNVATANGEGCEVRRLYPLESWRPDHESPSDRGLLIMGEDSCGNQFLYSREGLVLFRDHETDDEIVLADSLVAFLDSLSPPKPVQLEPGQVIRVWVSPEFLDEQRRRGNA
jgi:hypothetical protein